MNLSAGKGLWFFVGLFVSGVLLGIAGIHLKPHAYFFAYLALAVFYLISMFVTGSANPFRIAMGADGRLSTSKFQFFVWTGVVVFVYVLLFGSLDESHREILSRVPLNVLLVMGFSVTTAVAAKGITVSYLSSGQVLKPPSSQAGGDASLSGLVTHDDSNTPDLTKLQMLIWTAIAVVVYLYRTHELLPAIKSCNLAVSGNDALCKFPDIDQSLMVLMGISQGAYLGNKLVSAAAPQLVALSPSIGVPGTEITISGQSLGSSQNGSIILINGQDARVNASSWTDSSIHLTMPRKRPDATQWVTEEKVTVSAVINGQQTTSLLFTFAAKPVITAVSPQPLQKTSQVSVSGRNFGQKQAGTKLLLNSNDSTNLVTSWADDQVKFTLPGTLPGGAPWQAGVNVNITIALSDDFVSDAMTVSTA